MENNRTLTTTPNCAGLFNTSGTISCTSSIVGSPVNKVYITVTDLTNSALTNPFSISLQSILTPSYIDSSDAINIYSSWSDGSKIDTCKTTIVDLKPIKFQSLSFQSLDNSSVQSSFTGKLSLTIAKPFNYVDTIIFTVPEFFINATITSL
jgi:hypothetical protein